MTKASDIRVGDRVRLTGELWADSWADEGIPAPGIVKITRVEGDTALFEYGNEEWFIDDDWYAAEVIWSGLPKDLDAKLAAGKAAFPGTSTHRVHSGYEEHADGTLTDAGVASRQRHIDHIQEQDRIIRHRNNQIARQEATIAALQKQVTEYAGQAEERGLGLDAMLREFHKAFGIRDHLWFGSGDRSFSDLVERQHFLQEEVNELLLAVREGDEVAVADALADVIYIAAGTADRLRIPIDKVLRAVHAANMRKLGPDGKPVPHSTIPGKIGKPEGWTGPEADIVKILQERDGIA